VADTENDPGHAHVREQVPAAIMVDPRSAGALIERIAFALAAASRPSAHSEHASAHRRAPALGDDVAPGRAQLLVELDCQK